MLKEKSAVYVPEGLPASNAAVTMVAEELSAMFGGATALAAGNNGFWLDSDDELVRDEITIVYAFHSESTQRDFDRLRDLCTFLAYELNQDCISLEYAGMLHFVEGR